MAVDQAGNNVQAVFVPVGGFMAFAPSGTTIPTKAEVHDRDLVLPAAFKKVGLIKVDGGFEWTGEQDGDNIVRELVYGETPDANGVLDVELASNPHRYVLWTEEVDKWRRLRRRIAPNVGVGSNKEDKSERGSVNAQTTTFNVSRSDVIGGAHFREALIPAPADAPEPPLGP